MPIPVSVTLINKVHLFLLLIQFILNFIYPFFVYLIELVKRLLIICFKWILSPTKVVGILSSNSNIYFISLFSNFFFFF